MYTGFFSSGHTARKFNKNKMGATNSHSCIQAQFLLLHDAPQQCVYPFGTDAKFKKKPELPKQFRLKKSITHIDSNYDSKTIALAVTLGDALPPLSPIKYTRTPIF